MVLVETRALLSHKLATMVALDFLRCGSSTPSKEALQSRLRHTAAMEAVICDDRASLATMREEDFDARDYFGQSVVDLAVALDRRECLAVMLPACGSCKHLNVRRAVGATRVDCIFLIAARWPEVAPLALRAAVLLERLDVITALLARSPELVHQVVEEDSGRTALLMAASDDVTHCIPTLLAHSPEEQLRAVDKSGETAEMIMPDIRKYLVAA